MYVYKETKKGVDYMAKTKSDVQLTDDPLTNIHIMVPLLNDKEREAVSYLMYGCFLGEKLADKRAEQAAEPPALAAK